MSFRAALPLVVLLATVGCSRCTDKPLTGDTSELRLDLADRTFPTTFEGGDSTVELLLSNTGRATRRVTLVTQAPFFVDAGVSIGGGDEVTLTLHFRPTASGSFEETLAIASESDAAIDLRLHGNALPVPPCLSSNTCISSTFDVVRQVCIQTLKPNGTDCTGLCSTSSHCLEGNCVGDAISCDDHDACSIDACSPETGCVHSSAPVDACDDEVTPPCQTWQCDPIEGAVLVDALDGTPCGEATCALAHVCIAGTCTARVPPEGSVCGTESPCQSQGRCHAAQCERATAEPLSVLWQYDAGHVVASLTADDEGNLYWLELDVAGDDLVSVTKQGDVRYRRRLADTGLASTLRVSDGVLLVFDDQPTQALLVRAYEASTGLERWATDLTPSLPPMVPTAFAPSPEKARWIKRVVATAPDEVVVSVARFAETIHVALMSVDLRTGTVAWVRAEVGPALPVADQAGNLYFNRAGTWSALEDSVLSLSPRGEVRWQTNQADETLAVDGDELLLSSGQVVSTRDGSRRARLFGPMPGRDRALLSTCTSAAKVASVDGGTGSELELVSRRDGGVRWRHPERDLLESVAFATASEGVLILSADDFAGSPVGQPFSVTQLTRSGQPQFTCQVPFVNHEPSTFEFVVGAELQDERLVLATVTRASSSVFSADPALAARVVAFRLDRVHPAQRGWRVLQPNANRPYQAR